MSCACKHGSPRLRYGDDVRVDMGKNKDSNWSKTALGRGAWKGIAEE